MKKLVKTGVGFVFGIMLLVGQAGAVSYLPRARVVIDPEKKSLKRLQRDYPELIIDHVNASGYEVYGPEGVDSLLAQLKLEFYEEPNASEFMLSDYPSAEAVILKLQNLQKQYPKLISLIQIGKSTEGRPLVFAKITGTAATGSAKKVEFKYIANMHGDEIVGRELMVKLIEDLASHYGKDNRIDRILDGAVVYIMPSMNPDGATRKQRFNANGIDLNRTFPDFTTSDNQNTLGNRAPEVQAIMKFQAQHHFKLSANFHGGSQVVNYPWDAQPAPHPLDSFLKKISLDYANRVSYLRNSKEFKNGITNGYAWYEVKGGMQDWSNHWYNDVQVTIELTYIKWPSFSTVNATYLQNRDALLAYMEDVFQF